MKDCSKSLTSRKVDIRPKKELSCFPKIGRVKIFSPLTRPHSCMCIRIYIFCFKLKKHTYTHRNKEQKKLKKIEKQKKPKEEKEKENVVVVNNICGKSNGIQ